MLTVSGISKSFGGRTLFEEVSLQINRGDRLGLVGPNGAGKSTLLNLVLGKETPDDGTINFERNITFGFLPQESAPAGEETVLQLAVSTGSETHPARDEDAWHDDFEREPKAKKILSGLSFRETDFDRPLRELSGGWVMRAHLARLLVQEPDLLILDEPTNHLDLESLQWFQEYLRGYPGAILMISHDREFLNQLVDSIVEIRQSRVFRYRGNYDSFLVQKEAAEHQLLAAYKNQQKEIARLQEFADRFRAKASKASQAQSKLKQIERMDKIEAPVSENASIKFFFPQPARGGLKSVRLEGVHQAYGANVIYAGIDFEAERAERMVLVGPNGAGKSTLLKILAGTLPIQGGTRELGHNVKAGYYSQYRVDMLEPGRTVLEEALDTPQRLTEQYARTVLGSFLFRGDDVFKKVSVLSGGEKSRLALVKLLLDPPNLLLMDEPTTHLDMPSIDALIGALKQFEGTLVFISHDVYFIRQLASHVVHVQAGRLTHYRGDYQYFLDKTRSVSARQALVAGSADLGGPIAPPAPVVRVTCKTKEQKRAEAEERQARSRVRRDQQERVQQLEKAIAAAEARKADLVVELEKPETYGSPGRAMQINRELMQVEQELQAAEADWEIESGKLTALDTATAA